MVSSPYYDNQHWEFHLPINPPSPAPTKEDIMPHSIGILNWINDQGELEFRPRLRDNVQWVSRTGLSTASENDAPELDLEYDCD
jgi:hypothetical protein